MRKTFVGCLLVAAVLLLASQLPAKPGVVTNLQGQAFGGDVTEDDGFVYVDTSSGKVKLDKRNVVKIEYATPPTNPPAAPEVKDVKPPAPVGPAKSPEDVFKDKGLVRLGFMLVLPEETALHDLTASLRAARNKVNAEEFKRRDLESKLDQVQKDIDRTNAALVVAGQDLANHPNDNRAIGTHNALLSQMSLDESKSSELETQLHKLASSRSQYITSALDAADKAGAAAHIYDGPAKDAELATAIAQYNLTHKPAAKLGSSAYFAEDMAFVAACKKEVSSDVIPVTMRGGTPNVEVVINGTVTKTMIWDSGAAFVTLSAATAHDLKLHPTDQDPLVPLVTADGTKVQARMMTLGSIRIGSFTIEDVPCVVMPEAAKGDDLLGDTFQCNFQAKLNVTENTLQLTPLGTKLAEKKKKPPAVDAKGQQTVDLLDGISVADQTVKGTWHLRNGSLYSDLVETSRFDFNYRPPKEYDYKVTFTKLQGNESFSINLFANGRQFIWTMGGWDNTSFAFDQIDALDGNKNATTLKGRSLETGKPYNCVVQVRRDGVSAYLDGQLVDRYQTDYRDMNNSYPLHRLDSVGLMTNKTSYVISNAQIVEINGHGTKVIPSDPTNVKLLAVAQYVVGAENRTVKIYDNGHFGSPDDSGHKWYLRGHSLVFAWDWNVDELVLSDDVRTFTGHNRNDHNGDNTHGELISGSLTPEKPAAPGEEFAPPQAVAHRSALPAGLVLYLPFDKSDMDDVAHDHSSAHLSLPMHDVVEHAESGTGSHGTTTFSDGSYIDGKSFGQFPATESFTIALWVKAPDQKDGPPW